MTGWNLDLQELSTQVSQGGFAVPTLDGAGWHRLGDRPVVPENIACCICRLIRPNSIWSAWASVRRVGVGYGAAVGGGATGPFQIPLL